MVASVWSVNRSLPAMHCGSAMACTSTGQGRRSNIRTRPVAVLALSQLIAQKQPVSQPRERVLRHGNCRQDHVKEFEPCMARRPGHSWELANQRQGTSTLRWILRTMTGSTFRWIRFVVYCPDPDCKRASPPSRARHRPWRMRTRPDVTPVSTAKELHEVHRLVEAELRSHGAY